MSAYVSMSAYVCFCMNVSVMCVGTVLAPQDLDMFHTIVVRYKEHSTQVSNANYAITLYL